MSDRAGAVLNPRPAPHQVVGPLLEWARSNARELPWRETRDPWKILVSEIMLHQTQVARVVDRWREFIDRFPTATDCAGGTPADVIGLWAGLGYNRRAVSLWRAAVAIRDRFGGEVPRDLTELQRLPGVGPYTARAVLVFAFEEPVGVVDTNVGRLLARWVNAPLSASAAQQLADDLVPAGEAWRWNQALFDFAAAICTKHEPRCGTCAVADRCAWRGLGSDPATRSAGVSRPQSPFEGSRRQVRGRIVDALRTAPVRGEELSRFARPADRREDLEKIVAEMIADGLVIRHGSELRLPDG